MDLEEKMSGDQKSLNDNIEIVKKFCTDCKTTKTPLWRGGPSGPKSLCNACGIRYRKRRRANTRDRTAAGTTVNSATSGDSGSENGLDLRDSLKMRLMVVGNKMKSERSKIVKKQRCQRRRKLLREEEQAAFSLMALSCGSVFA